MTNAEVTAKEPLSCFRKHIALAASYARECSKGGGHGKGGKPDHRIDLSGELINAEMHASVFDLGLTLRLRHLRRRLQSRRFSPEAEDVEQLSAFWFASFFLEGGPDKVKEIAVSDPQLALLITAKFKEFMQLPKEPENSDVTLSCHCRQLIKPQNGIGAGVGFPTKIYTFGKLLEQKELAQLEQNLKKFFSGFESLKILPESELEFPNNLPDDDQSMYVFWPSEVRLLKEVNVYTLPNVIDSTKFFNRDDAHFLNLAGNVMRRNCFFKLPMLVFPQIAATICNDYESITGKRKIGDFYSVYRCFGMLPSFTADCKAFIRNDEQPAPETVYRIIE